MSATTVRVPGTAASLLRRPDGLISEGRLRGLCRRLDRVGGGFSISATSGWDVRSGFAVSVHPEREQQVGGRVWASDLLEYVRANWDLLSRPGAVLGGWRDHAEDDESVAGLAYLDVTTVVHDRRRAAALARAHGQRAFYDLSSGVEIRA